MNFSIGEVLVRLGQFYTWLIIIYVLMSWFPLKGTLYDVYRVIGSVVEPYVGLFRRFIPPIGAVDISPIIAILVLNVFMNYVIRPLAAGL
jgi:YggT family protein